jgi:hypothetical protein
MFVSAATVWAGRRCHAATARPLSVGRPNVTNLDAFERVFAVRPRPLNRLT